MLSMNPHRPRQPTEEEDIDPDLVRQQQEIDNNRAIAYDSEHRAVFLCRADRERVEEVLRVFDGELVDPPRRKSAA
jgi:hypothetical protein